MNLSRDEGDETITERENKYKCSLQALSEPQKVGMFFCSLSWAKP